MAPPEDIALESVPQESQEQEVVLLDDDSLSHASPDVSQKPKSSEFIVIMITIFVDMLAFGILFPILPFLALKFNASGALVGLVMSSFNFFNFIGSTILGRISDKIGRKPILLISLCGATAGQILLGFSNSLTMVFLARGIAGFSGGSISVAQAYIADITAEKDRAKYLGYLGAAAGLGIVCGPALGGLLSGFGFAWVSFSAAMISGPNMLLALFILKEPSRLNASRRSLTVSDLAKIASQKSLLALMLVQLLASFSFAGLEVSLSLFGYRKFGMTSTTAGIILAVYGVAMVIIQGGVVGVTRRYFADRTIATCALCGFGATLFSIGFVPLFSWLFIVVTLNALSYGFFGPSMSGLCSTNAASDVQGFVLGLFASMSSLGRMLSPSIAGAIMDANDKAAFMVIGSLSICGAIVLQLSGFSQSGWQPVSAEITEDAQTELAEVKLENPEQ